MEAQPTIAWAPQPGPQEALINAPFQLVGFGGARGGGKTDGVLGKFAIKEAQYGKAFNAVFFRKEMPQADDLIDRAKEIYLPLGAHWHDQKKLFDMPNGGRVRFRPLETDDDAAKYQGQNLSDAAVEESGGYADPAPIWKLFGALRSASGTPTQLILTFNPGGTGHWWLKEKFIKPAPHGLTPIDWVLPTGTVVKYIYIPSRVKDNKILMQKDPGYVDRLHLVGSPELVRAWLEGDFEIHEGSYFPEFSSRHIIAPFTIPLHWPRYSGLDWGYASPFCCLWAAVSSGKDDYGRPVYLTDGRGQKVEAPQGALIFYRELWGKKIENVEMGRAISEAQGSEELISVADPSIFSHDGGPSIADQIREGGAHFREANNDRLSGWGQIRSRLRRDPAMIFITTDCPYLLECLPSAPMDKKNPEDLDTTSQFDHALDSCRYVCKERLLEPDYHEEETPIIRRGSIQISRYIEKAKRDMKASSSF